MTVELKHYPKNIRKDVKEIIDYHFEEELGDYLEMVESSGCKDHIFNSIAKVKRAMTGNDNCVICGKRKPESIDRYFCRKCLNDEWSIELDEKGGYEID
jgi:hypothetical protein